MSAVSSVAVVDLHYRVIALPSNADTARAKQYGSGAVRHHKFGIVC